MLGAGLSGFVWLNALGFRESLGAASCLAEQEAETPGVWIAMRCPLTQWLWAPPPLPSAAFHISTRFTEGLPCLKLLALLLKFIFYFEAVPNSQESCKNFPYPESSESRSPVWSSITPASFSTRFSVNIDPSLTVVWSTDPVGVSPVVPILSV